MPEANVKHQPHRLLLLFPGEIRPKLVESEAFLIGLIGISTLHCYDYNLMAIRQLHVVVSTDVEMFMTFQVEGGRVTARESGLDPETEQLTEMIQGSS